MANNRFSFIKTCSFVLLSLWLLSIPVLPVIAIWRYIVGNKQFSMLTLSIWLISFVAFYFYNEAHKKADKAMKLQKEIEYQESTRKRLEWRKLNGIMKLNDTFVLVESNKWDKKWNDRRNGFVDWLEDEIQQLQPDDKVYAYSHGHGMGMRHGYVIVRKEKVVAHALVLMS